MIASVPLISVKTLNVDSLTQQGMSEETTNLWGHIFASVSPRGSSCKISAPTMRGIAQGCSCSALFGLAVQTLLAAHHVQRQSPFPLSWQFFSAVLLAGYRAQRQRAFPKSELSLPAVLLALNGVQHPRTDLPFVFHGQKMISAVAALPQGLIDMVLKGSTSCIS